MVILVPGIEIRMLLLAEKWIATVTMLRVIMMLVTGAADGKVDSNSDAAKDDNDADNWCC